MMKLVFILVVAVVACAWLSGVSAVCGRQLSEQLFRMCTDEQKRSWWGPRARALVSGRSKRLIVDECCERVCSVEELMTFCQY
ncbi:insulin-related peptide 2-like [Trichoplusia ni]|uniref:Insulin-related peptide 2-like n=1 Tax=Trichoplusia ni TaxID=7111 RepID=A0A7E5VYP6_TRINI|nr:insulin-related peptide 2-like [Trichoplusia ni]